MNHLTTPPDGIIITWSQASIREHGGLLSFIRYFEKTMEDPDALWLQKCKYAPKQEVIYVYIVVCNQVRYRGFYGGHRAGATTVYNGDGITLEYSRDVDWPRIVMAGPIEKAPHKIPMRGFQGFRYTEKLF